MYQIRHIHIVNPKIKKPILSNPLRVMYKTAKWAKNLSIYNIYFLVSGAVSFKSKFEIE
jgi:hypothetical protein